MCVFFYLPRHHLPSAERQAQWAPGRAPEFIQAGKSASAQSWIYQTWVEVRDHVEIELVHEMPPEGAVVTLSNLLPTGFRANPQQFVAAIVADFLPHPGAQLQIVQNLAHARHLAHAAFLPHWPQPNLLPRDADRGDRVETLAFFGDVVNLAPELRTPAFAKMLRDECRGRLEIRGTERWHDYHDVDIAVAVRGFDRSPYFRKPATKLYNAWLAGVPLIGGIDSAFRAEGTPDENYLVARSPAEFATHVRHLRAEGGRYRALVDAGRTKASSRSREAVKERWRQFLADELPAHAARWQKRSSLSKAFFWPQNAFAHALDRQLHR